VPPTDLGAAYGTPSTTEGVIQNSPPVATIDEPFVVVGSDEDLAVDPHLWEHPVWDAAPLLTVGLGADGQIEGNRHPARAHAGIGLLRLIGRSDPGCRSGARLRIPEFVVSSLTIREEP
jgi:hypothetical protein